MKRILALSLAFLSACGGSGGATSPSPVSPAPTPRPGPTTLIGRSVETDQVTGTPTLSGSEITIAGSGFFTLQTALSLHSNGVAYLRPNDGDMSAAAVSPFVFWNSGRSIGWPASTTTITYVPEAAITADGAATAAIDAALAKFNGLGIANVNGQRITFARATAASGASCQMRVDPNDADIVANDRNGWTRWQLSSGVIVSCTIIFRAISDARSIVASHEMVHGLGLGHTSRDVSGITLMDAGVVNDIGLLNSLARVVSTNIAMSLRRRPNTLLTGNTEDERGASAAGLGLQEVGIH